MKRTSTQTCHRSRRSTSQVKAFLFNEKETFENPGRREQAPKRATDPEKIKLSSQNRLFQREKKHLKVPREENKHLNRSFDPEYQTFKSKLTPQDGD